MWDAKVSPWTSEWLLLALLGLQVESVLGLDVVQVENIEDLVVRAEGVLLDDSLSLVD